MLSEFSGARSIGLLLLHVLTAIQFDRKFACGAGKSTRKRPKLLVASLLAMTEVRYSAAAIKGGASI